MEDVGSLLAYIDSQDAGGVATVVKGEPPPLPPAERFKIVRAEIKNGKRIAGAIKIAPYGRVKADERFVAATVQELGGGSLRKSLWHPASMPSPRCSAKKE